MCVRRNTGLGQGSFRALPALAWLSDSGVYQRILRLRRQSALRVNSVYRPVSSGEIIFDGVGGVPGDSFAVVIATNISTRPALWIPGFTDNFGGFGECSFTNAINLGVPRSLFTTAVLTAARRDVAGSGADSLPRD
jgi:hypothetical protein